MPTEDVQAVHVAGQCTVLQTKKCTAYNLTNDNFVCCVSWHGEEGVECDFLYHFLTNWDTSSARSTVTNTLLYTVTDITAKIEM